MTFEHVADHPIPDKDLTAAEYRHPSGLRHFHVPSSFPEIGFALVFPTLPPNDTGMPHILEHLVMCGSDKFRQKDPFFSMLDRSVAHDLNAYTARTHTAYHFATTDRTDYLNLAELYADLALNPLLRRADFDREGWRLEQDETGAPRLNGVVLNEMLGAFGKPETHIHEAWLRAVAPDSAEANISGGLPLAIPALSYEDLRRYYAERYAPGVAVLITTGRDVPVDAVQAVLDETVARRRIRDAADPAPAPAPRNAVAHDASAHESLAVEERGSADGRALRTVFVPGEADEPSRTHWVWSAPWAPSSEDELRDQMLSLTLFGDHSAAIQDLQRALGTRVTVQFVPDGSRYGGRSGIVLMAEGLGAEAAADATERVEQAVRAAVAEGVDADVWAHTLAQVAHNTLRPGPLRDSAPEMVGALLAGLPLAQDFDNRAVVARLTAQGAPTPEVCAAWWDRWEAGPVLTTAPDPALMGRWRARLDEIARAKWAAGERPSGAVAEEVASDATLPLLDAAHLDPVAPLVAGIWSVPARSTDGWTAAVPDAATEAALRTGAAAAPLVAGGNTLSSSQAAPQTAAHVHAWTTSDDPTCEAVLRYDITSLSAAVRCALGAFTLMTPHVGRNGRDAAATRAFDASEQIDTYAAIEWTGTHDPASARLTWGVDIQAAASGAVGARALTAGLRDVTTGAPAFDAAEWTAAAKMALADIIRTAERRKRREKEEAALAQMDAMAKRQSEATTRVDDLVAWLERAIKHPQESYQEAVRAVAVMRSDAPRQMDTTGDRDALTAGEAAARALASDAPAWTSTAPQGTAIAPPTGTTGAGAPRAAPSHIPEPAAGNVCKRVFAAPHLRTDDEALIAARVACSMLELPFLHARIREEGGAYGARAEAGQGRVMLHSYRDPQTDATFAVFDRAAAHLRATVAAADPEVLARARLAVAKQLLNPGDGTTYLERARKMNEQGHRPDRAQDLLEILGRVDWAQVAGVIDLFDPARTPSVDVAIGPDAPLFAAPASGPTPPAEATATEPLRAAAVRM